MPPDSSPHSPVLFISVPPARQLLLLSPQTPQNQPKSSSSSSRPANRFHQTLETRRERPGERRDLTMQQEKKEEPKNLALALTFSRMPDEEEEEQETTSPVETGSPQEISAAQRPRELDHIHSLDEEEEEEVSDFEFSFVCREPETTTADQIFSNGQIRPVYPVFNRNIFLFQGGGGDLEEDNDDDVSSTTSSSRVEKVVRIPLGKLFIEERDRLSCSSSESDDLEGLPEESYCVWNPRSVPPSPDNRKKSNSAGSSRRWRLRNLVGRSHSDGKDKFVFMARNSEKNSPEREKKTPEKEKKKSPGRSPGDNSAAAAGEEVKKGKGGVKYTEMDMVTAHRMFYGKGGGDGDRRRSFLPYRKDLVGFFGNVTGVSRGCPS